MDPLARLSRLQIDPGQTPISANMVARVRAALMEPGDPAGARDVALAEMAGALLDLEVQLANLHETAAEQTGIIADLNDTIGEIAEAVEGAHNIVANLADAVEKLGGVVGTVVDRIDLR